MGKRRISSLKPSGYAIVNRNRDAIKVINAKFKKAGTARRKELVDEKDRLLHEMWDACPHQDICHCDDVKTAFRPDPKPMRFCGSCGFDESSVSGRFKVLNRSRRRFITHLLLRDFRERLGTIMRWTGINL